MEPGSTYVDLLIGSSEIGWESVSMGTVLKLVLRDWPDNGIDQKIGTTRPSAGKGLEPTGAKLVVGQVPSPGQ
jgi:hypothetical protein